MNRKIIFALLISVIAIGVFLILHFRTPVVEVAAVVRGPVVQAVYATGTVEPSILVEIAPRIGARLVQLFVDEGAPVRAGDLLAQLDDGEPRAQLGEAKSRESLAQQEFERVSKLIKRRSVSQDEFDRVRSSLQVATAEREAAEARLAYATLRAPADGFVIRRDGEVGDLIMAHRTIFWFSASKALRITAEVDEEDIPEVALGQKVLIRADAFPGKVFNGKVASITPKGDPIARSYRVRIGFEEETPLRIGMTAESNIIIRKIDDVLLLPTEAVSKGSVFLMEGSRVSVRPVNIGVRGADLSEVQSGLSEGDTVVVAPPAWLEDGMRVRFSRRG